MEVEDGKSATFTIKPDEGFEIREVKVDGEDIGPVESYTFTDVTGDHTLYVVFQEKVPETPSPSPSDGGGTGGNGRATPGTRPPRSPVSALRGVAEWKIRVCPFIEPDGTIAEAAGPCGAGVEQPETVFLTADRGVGVTKEGHIRTGQPGGIAQGIQVWLQLDPVAVAMSGEEVESAQLKLTDQRLLRKEITISLHAIQWCVGKCFFQAIGVTAVVAQMHHGIGGLLGDDPAHRGGDAMGVGEYQTAAREGLLSKRL